MGTGSFARTSEAPINQNSTFAKSAGASATHNGHIDRPESFPPLRSTDREHTPLVSTGADGFGRTSNAKQPESTPPEDTKKKRKRLLLLLLILLITFTAGFLGFGGLSLLGLNGESDAPAQQQVTTVSTPSVSQPVADAVPAAKTVDAAPVAADPSTEKPVVDPDKLVEEVIPTSQMPARIADVTSPGTQFNITYPELIPPPAAAAKSKTNFVSFEVNAKLAEDPDTRVFSMVPSTPDLKGTASLSWSTVSGSVLFRCKDLPGNTAGSNYVLYYIDENDKAQRMMAFAVASGAELMLIPPRIPSRGVKRVVLTLEKSVKTQEGAAVRREEVLYSDYKEKALLTKPLK